MKKFISKITENIEKSEDFDFKSERSKKFISEFDPVFLLKCNDETLINKFKRNTSLEQEIIDEITHKLDVEILRKTNEYITDCVTDKDKFDTLFNNLPEEFSNLYLSNIYIIRISVQENTITLKYFV
jgi:hypothetical protein